MHIYTKNGKEYPSVTTILDCLGQKEIIKWANWLGFRHIDYETELNERADFGTKVHDVLRSVVDDSYSSVLSYKNPLEMMAINKIKNRFINMMKPYRYETIATEMPIISESLGYAGTLDWLAKFNGKYLFLNDFKTSKAARFKHLLQMGGYRNILVEQGYRLDGANIIIVNRDYCDIYTIGKNELSIYGEAFNYLAKYFIMKESITMEQNMNAKKLLGGN